MNSTVGAYNNAAQNYDRKFSTYDVYINRMRDFLLRVPMKSHILDLGCGSGINAELMALQGHMVTGVDISESMLSIARERCPGQRFIESSAHSLLNSPEKYNLMTPFDALCLSFIIVHLDEEECFSLLNNLNHLLTENGLLYLSFMPRLPGKNPGWEETSFSKDKIYFHYHHAESVIAILENNGFSLESRVKEDYREGDGTLTVDLFLIFRKREQGA